MARAHLNNQKGQTAVEYIFLLAVMVTVITSLLSVIKNKYLGDVSKCNPDNQKQLLCKINSIISDSGESPKKFQYYRFSK
jgi:Flp pilus assembly pilin Flp